MYMSRLTWRSAMFKTACHDTLVKIDMRTIFLLEKKIKHEKHLTTLRSVTALIK